MRLNKWNSSGLNLNRNRFHLVQRLLLVLQRNHDRNILDVGLLLAGNIFGVVDDLRLVHGGWLVNDCCGLLVTLRLLGLIHNILLLINNLRLLVSRVIYDLLMVDKIRLLLLMLNYCRILLLDYHGLLLLNNSRLLLL